MVEQPGEQAPFRDDAGDSMGDLLDASEQHMHAFRRGEIVEGYVVHIEPEEILVDVGLKSEGVVSGREIGSEDDLARLCVGQKVLVYVLQQENAEGRPVLSLRRADVERHWRRAEDLFTSGEIVEAPVIDANRGGLILDLGIRGFMPISQLQDLRRDEARTPLAGEDAQAAADEALLAKLQQMLGRRLPIKVIELNRTRNRLIVSERAAMQEWRGKRKDALLAELHTGDVRRGRVTSLTDFGAFIDLGGADGLVHISELSWTRVNHPREVVQVGDEVDVMVLSVDPTTKKIALSLKQAQPDPWGIIVSQYEVGQIVPATITKLAKFGAFARLENGVEGLIHISEISDRRIASPGQVVEEGEAVYVMITSIDSERRRLGLSIRQAMERPDPDYQGSGQEPQVFEGPADHDILNQQDQPPNSEFQKLASLRFDDEVED